MERCFENNDEIRKNLVLKVFVRINEKQKKLVVFHPQRKHHIVLGNSDNQDLVSTHLKINYFLTTPDCHDS